jgi:hypothetical protein
MCALFEEGPGRNGRILASRKAVSISLPLIAPLVSVSPDRRSLAAEPPLTTVPVLRAKGLEDSTELGGWWQKSSSEITVCRVVCVAVRGSAHRREARLIGRKPISAHRSLCGPWRQHGKSSTVRLAYLRTQLGHPATNPHSLSYSHRGPFFSLFLSLHRHRGRLCLRPTFEIPNRHPLSIRVGLSSTALLNKFRPCQPLLK